MTLLVLFLHLNIFFQAAFGLNLNIIMDENDLFLKYADKILEGFFFKFSNPLYKVIFTKYFNWHLHEVKQILFAYA